ncbi:hypothetical protein ACLOAV_005153 [Pseudogymnoascus australis]
MKWGLIPSWTKRAPDFSASLKTINCRSESLMSSHGGMWSSMKQRKRCVVLVEGFFEWLHRGREKDFVRPVGKGRGKIEGFFGGGKKDGAKKEEEEGKEGVKDEGIKREEVKGEVGKKEEVKDEGVKKEEEQDHKYNLRNEPTTKKEEPNEGDIKMESIEDDNVEESDEIKRETTKKEEADEEEEYKPEPPRKKEADEQKPKKEEQDSKPKPEPDSKEEIKQGIKREHDDSPSLDRAEPAKKATRTSASPVKVKESPSKTEGRGLRSSTRNDRGVVVPKAKKGEKGEQKITGFFGKK